MVGHSYSEYCMAVLKLFLSPALKLSQLLGYCDGAAVGTGVENLCMISDSYPEVELLGHEVLFLSFEIP